MPVSPDKFDDTTSCKKCKKKVTEKSYMHCADCDTFFHPSCYNVAVKRGNEEHTMLPSSDIELTCGELPVDSDIKMIEDLKNENRVLKKEVDKLKSQLNKLTMQVAKDMETAKNAAKTGTTTKTADNLSQQMEAIWKNINENIELKFANLTKQLEKKFELMDKEKTKTTTRTYSQVAVNKSTSCKLIIKPKNNGQSPEQTLKLLQKEIHPENDNIAITEVRKLSKNGGVIIGCKDKNDLNKLYAQVGGKIDNTDYKFIKTTTRSPQIKIVGLDAQYDGDTLKACIKNQNATLQAIDKWEFVVCKKMKTKYMAIFKLDPDSLQKITALEKLFINWNVCKVYEHFNIHRCYECGGFNHNSKNCVEEDILCLTCGKDKHTEDNCNSEVVSCVNCIRANKKFNLQLETEHSRFDNENCEVLRRQLKHLREKTDYSNT